MATERVNKLKRSEERSDDTSLSGIYLKYGLTVLKATALAIIMTVVLLLISAVILLVTGIDDNASPYIVQVVRIVCICVAGLICGNNVPKMGWLAGMAAGMCYVLITVLSGIVFFGGTNIDSELLFDVVTALIAGLISGVVGINTSKRKNTDFY